MPPKADPTALTLNPRAGIADSSSSKSTSAAEKRRIAATAASNTAAAVSQSNDVNPNGQHAHEGIEGMDWNDIPTSVLHEYRSTFRLPTTSASESYASMVLSAGIGKKSPTYRARKTSRDSLVTAVRKHFNSFPINENEVVVNFLYSIKNQDKAFRLRFTPGGSTSGR